MTITFSLSTDDEESSITVSDRLAPQKKMMRVYRFMIRYLVKTWSPSATREQRDKFIRAVERQFLREWRKLWVE